MRLTIRDIAKKAGVSRSTVSRVLTDNPNVNTDTRNKVKKIIEENMYQPSYIARGLAQGRINLIALIISDIRNPFYSELTWIIGNILSKNDFIVALFDTENDYENESVYLKTAKQYGFAGVIMVSAMESNNLMSIINSMDCPIILLNRYINSFEGDIVIIDDFQGGYTATRHLIELGHTKIGMLTGDVNYYNQRDRYRGYTSALQAFDIERRNDYIKHGNLDLQSGYDYGLSLLKMGSERPTAVFAANDVAAIGIMETLKKNGLSIPEDISIVGFDDIPLASTYGINLTTVRYPYDQMGQKAAELILEKVKNDKAQYNKIILNPSLIIRGTTSAAKRY